MINLQTKYGTGNDLGHMEGPQQVTERVGGNRMGSGKTGGAGEEMEGREFGMF